MGFHISLGKLASASMAGLIAFGLSFATVHAEEEPATVQQRLEKLEKQNAELQKLLEGQLGKSTDGEAALKRTNGISGSTTEILSLPAQNAPTQTKEKAGADAAKSPYLFKFQYKDGFWAETEDKNFSIHVMPFVQFDNGWYSVGDNINTTMDTRLNDGSDLRRMRPRFEGKVFQQFSYQFEFDVSGGTDFRTLAADPQAPLFITDAWMGMDNIPFLGTVRIGHQKEYLSFNNGTSSRFQTFMERPLIFDAFEDPYQFDNGVTVFNSYFEKRLHTYSGFFRTGTRTGAFGIGDGRYAFDERVVWFPILDPENQRWFLLGAAGSVRALPYSTFPTSSTTTTLLPTIRFFNRPTVRAGGGFQIPRVISTPQMFSNEEQTILILGAQGAFGRWTFGGEYAAAYLGETYLNTIPGYVPPTNANGRPAQSIGNMSGDGFYVQALYFLTPGDHHEVNTQIPGWSRVKPCRPFMFRRSDDGEVTKGPGAWEIGVRYDVTNYGNPFFQQAFVPIAQSGGRYQVLNFAINWYWNPNMKVMADYTYNLRGTGQEGGNGTFSAFGMRTQMDF